MIPSDFITSFASWDIEHINRTCTISLTNVHSWRHIPLLVKTNYQLWSAVKWNCYIPGFYFKSGYNRRCVIKLLHFLFITILVATVNHFCNKIVTIQDNDTFWFLNCICLLDIRPHHLHVHNFIDKCTF